MTSSARTLPLREAKAGLSAVVEAAERGEATIITKHGRPAAVVTPLEAAQAWLDPRPSLAALLMEAPEPFAFDRDPSGLRDIEL